VLNNVVNVKEVQTPTEIDHYQIQRAIDVYVTPTGEDLGRITSSIRDILAKTQIPGDVRVNLRGMVQGMEASFKSFARGFLISFLLLFLILTAQFKSFIDPFLIMLAIPMGFVGVLLILPLTHSTLNVMSLMGVLMLVGIADSNSILIVDFAHNLEKQGLSAEDAVITACRVRLRPILMTSLATIIGMIRTYFVGSLDHLHRACGLPAGVWPAQGGAGWVGGGGAGAMKQRHSLIGNKIHDAKA
jgi:multidrug efflux pump subunit AcrB